MKVCCAAHDRVGQERLQRFLAPGVPRAQHVETDAGDDRRQPPAKVVGPGRSRPADALPGYPGRHRRPRRASQASGKPPPARGPGAPRTGRPATGCHPSATPPLSRASPHGPVRRRRRDSTTQAAPRRRDQRPGPAQTSSPATMIRRIGVGVLAAFGMTSTSLVVAGPPGCLRLCDDLGYCLAYRSCAAVGQARHGGISQEAGMSTGCASVTARRGSSGSSAGPGGGARGGRALRPAGGAW